MLPIITLEDITQLEKTLSIGRNPTVGSKVLHDILHDLHLRDMANRICLSLF